MDTDEWVPEPGHRHSRKRGQDPLPESINITVHNIEHMFKSMNSLVAPPFETLVWLGRNPRQSYYVRELAKVLSISTGAASGQLRMLDEQGLITSEQKGRTLMYRANISHPVVREVKILATLLELSPLIASLANSAERMILFGSAHPEKTPRRATSISSSRPLTARQSPTGFRSPKTRTCGNSL